MSDWSVMSNNITGDDQIMSIDISGTNNMEFIRVEVDQ